MKLTERQKQIWTLACNGLTRQEIAHELGVAPGTISAHMRQVRIRLGRTVQEERGLQIKLLATLLAHQAALQANEVSSS